MQTDGDSVTAGSVSAVQAHGAATSVAGHQQAAGTFHRLRPTALCSRATSLCTPSALHLRQMQTVEAVSCQLHGAAGGLAP